MFRKTLKELLKTKLEPVVEATKEYQVNGITRTMLRVRKARGKRIYLVVRYENGLYSLA